MRLVDLGGPALLLIVYSSRTISLIAYTILSNKEGNLSF